MPPHIPMTPSITQSSHVSHIISQHYHPGFPNTILSDELLHLRGAWTKKSIKIFQNDRTLHFSMDLDFSDFDKFGPLHLTIHSKLERQAHQPRLVIHTWVCKLQ